MKVSSLIIFFNDCLKLKWTEPTERLIEDVSVVSEVDRQERINGLTWLSLNFPNLSQVQDFSLEDRSGLCNTVSVLHRYPEAVYPSRGRGLSLAEVSPGLRWLRETFPSLTCPSGYGESKAKDSHDLRR